MAPRFVEVVTPVEDGMDALTGAVLRGARLVTWMTSAAVSNMVTHFNSSLHDVEFLDASNAANVCAASASLPRGLAMNLILAATGITAAPRQQTCFLLGCRKTTHLTDTPLRFETVLEDSC